VGQQGPAVLAVRVRRRARPDLGHQPTPADLEVRPVPAVPQGRPIPAPRLRPGDRRVLADLVLPGDLPDQRGREGQPHQQALEDLAVPCKPPTLSSRWQQEWSPPVASALPWGGGNKETALAPRMRSSSDRQTPCVNVQRGGRVGSPRCSAELELDEGAAIAHLACRKLDLARFCELARIAEEIEQYLPPPQPPLAEKTIEIRVHSL
jgi:hypothetical protein